MKLKSKMSRIEMTISIGRI